MVETVVLPVDFDTALAITRELHSELVSVELNTASFLKWNEYLPRVEAVRDLVNVSWRAVEGPHIRFTYLHQYLVQLASAIECKSRLSVDAKLRQGIQLP